MSNVNLYAIWNANTCTINFNANGGSGGQTTSVTATYGQPMPEITAQAPTYPGYSFIGYYDAQTDGIKYYNSDMTSARDWGVAGDTTLYARWTEIDPYMITFDPNGGIGGPNQIEVSFGDAIEAIGAEKLPINLGHYFGGYYDAKTDGTMYYDNNLFPMKEFWDKEEDTTLYARWTEIPEVTITFNSNYGSNQTETQSVRENTSADLRANTFVRIGHTFTGWALTETGNIEYEDKENYTVGTSNVNLYAIWNVNSYTISFHVNGGIGGQTTSVTATYGQPMPPLTAQAPTWELLAQPALGATWTNSDRSNWLYYFGGYYDAQTGGTKYYDVDLSPVKDWDKGGDTTLYARWTPIKGDSSIAIGLYDYVAPFAETAPVIDGNGDDPVWAKAQWRPIDQVWLGGGNASGTNLTPPLPANFSGRFKIVWTEDRLYYLTEIRDSYLSLTRLNTPLTNYWEDDILELFINEDALGGDHERNHNAFAYHLSYNGTDVRDVGTNGQPILFNEHLDYAIGNLDLPNRRSIDGTHLYTWEVEMKVFDRTYNQNIYAANTPVKLSEGKRMGFAVAYCDAGLTNRREYFMGSMHIEGTNKNVAWQNASVFAKLYLVK